MKFRKYIIFSSVFSLVSGSFALFSPAVQADTNPATAPMTVSCTAIPAKTVGTQHGLPAATIGEKITLVSSAHFDAGTVYQAALTRPDGSKYFASAVELIPANNIGFTPDINSLVFTQDGSPVSLVNGVEPVTGAFVLDSTAPNGTYRVLFPGDAATRSFSFYSGYGE